MGRDETGIQNLAKAVICQAYYDACSRKDTYIRSSARCFLMGKNKIWLNSLKNWCEVAGIDYYKIIKKSRKLWWQ